MTTEPIWLCDQQKAGMQGWRRKGEKQVEKYQGETDRRNAAYGSEEWGYQGLGSCFEHLGPTKRFTADSLWNVTALRETMNEDSCVCIIASLWTTELFTFLGRIESVLEMLIPKQSLFLGKSSIQKHVRPANNPSPSSPHFCNLTSVSVFRWGKLFECLNHEMPPVRRCI